MTEGISKERVLSGLSDEQKAQLMAMKNTSFNESETKILKLIFSFLSIEAKSLDEYLDAVRGFYLCFASGDRESLSAIQRDLGVETGFFLAKYAIAAMARSVEDQCKEAIKETEFLTQSSAVVSGK